MLNPALAARWITSAMRRSPLIAATSGDSSARTRYRDSSRPGNVDLGHRGLAQRRENLRDVAEEQSVRPDDEQALAFEAIPVLEEEERGAVEPDRGLARTGPALHDQAFRQRRSNHLVLFRLDGRDDVAHLARTPALQLRQQRVRDTTTAARSGGIRVREVLVEETDELATVERKPPAESNAHRVRPRRAVEGNRDVRAPVDDNRVAPLVLDVTPAHVEPFTLLFVQPPECERDRGVRQRGEPPLQLLEQQRRVDARLLPGPALPDLDVARGAGAHRRETGVRVVEIGLFGREIGVE